MWVGVPLRLCACMRSRFRQGVLHARMLAQLTPLRDCALAFLSVCAGMIACVQFAHPYVSLSDCIRVAHGSTPGWCCAMLCFSAPCCGLPCCAAQRCACGNDSH
eukprot:11667578-Alexandrium_andersonii.AAC.1